MKRKCYACCSLSFFALLLIAVAACDSYPRYHSIWKDVYGTVPPYQQTIERMELVEE